jgi:hypothetical protein
MVFIKDMEGDDLSIYIYGKYVIGEYFAQFECAVAVARVFNSLIEIEYWECPRNEDGDSVEMPAELPDNFAELWNLQLNEYITKMYAL